MSIAVFAIVLASCCLLLRWLDKQAEMYTACANQMQAELDVFIADVSVSPLCCRCIVSVLGEQARRECFRCRGDRGEPITEQSQLLAEEIQQRAMTEAIARRKAAR